MDTLSVIRTFLEERLDIPAERVQPEAALEALGIDSLMLLELMFEFEEKLNINLSKDIPTPKKVGDLLAIVADMQGTQTAG